MTASRFVRRASLCLPCLATLLLHPVLRAEDSAPSRALTLDECLSRATAQNPSLRSGALREQSAAHRAKQASKRLNPKLEGEVENVAGSGDVSGFQSAETTVAIAQEIETGGKRRQRTRAAQAEAAVVRADEQVRRTAALFETRRAFLGVLAAQERIRLSEEALAVIRDTEAVARAREQAGKGTAQEAESAHAEAEQAALELLERRAEQRDAVRELALCWGETDPSFDAVSGALGAAVETPPALDALLVQAAEAPARKAAEAQAAAAQAKVQVERAARLPNVELAAGMRHFSESDDVGFVASVGVPLPLFDRNLDAVRAAQADAEAARLDAVADRLKAEGALRRLHARLAALANSCAGLRDRVVPSAERALGLARKAHEQGKTGYLEVLDARRSLMDAKLALIEAEARFQSCRIELDEQIAPAVHAAP